MEGRVKIKAIAPWFGSKRSMAQRIVAECLQPNGKPPKSFWDLCCGSLAVSLAMPHCAHHTAVDLHGDLINLARVIQDADLGPKFYRHLRRCIFHEQLFRDAKAAIARDKQDQPTSVLFDGADPGRSLSPLERATAYFIACWQGRNGVAGTERVNYQPCVRWTSGGGAGGVRFANTVNSIPAWRRRLRSIYILDRDIFQVIPRIEDQVGTTLYLDTPYVRDGARSGSSKYEHEFNGLDHIRLARELQRFKKARVVVSHYDHPLLHELYRSWTFVDCMTQKNLHVQNRRGVGRCEAPEVLIINGESSTADWDSSDKAEEVEAVE